MKRQYFERNITIIHYTMRQSRRNRDGDTNPKRIFGILSNQFSLTTQHISDFGFNRVYMPWNFTAGRNASNDKTDVWMGSAPLQ